MVKQLVLISLLVGCQPVKQDPQTDAPATPGIDAAVDSSPDADPCPPYAPPPGSLSLHAAFCTAALGSDGAGMTMALPCPGTGAAVPGQFGKILRPGSAAQVDGCMATQPVTRILAPLTNNALTQVQTAQNITVNANSRFRVRVACPFGVANCGGRIQVTGRPSMGGVLTAIQDFLVITDGIRDIDAAMPAALIGSTTIITLIVQNTNNGRVPDLLWENPTIGP